MRLSLPNRLLLAAGMLVAGEACGFALHVWTMLWPLIASMAGLVLLAAYGWGARGLLMPTVFFLGVVLAARSESDRIRILEETRFVSNPPPVTVKVEAPVNRWRAKKHDGWTVDFQSHLGPVQTKVVMALPDGAAFPSVGETWTCSGRLSCKGEEEERRARYTLWVLDPSKARLTKPAGTSVSARYEALGTRMAEQVSIGLDWSPEIASLNRAILLGQRSGLSWARRKTFSAAGTIHVFAISGLHVMVIALVLNSVLSRLDVQVPLRGLITVPAVAAYVMLTGMRPSALRAATMLAIYMLAPVFGRRPNARTAWSITALGVYGYAPERLFDLGCALSFAVMFGIVLWVEWSRGFAPIAKPGSNVQKLLGCLGISFAAWVAGVPITAHAFGRFSVGGLVANVAVIYCAGWMVKCGVFGLAASFFCIPLAAIANNLSGLCTFAMTLVSEQVAKFPFVLVETPYWTAWHSVTWYAAWIAACLAAGRLFPRNSSAPKPWWI